VTKVKEKLENYLSQVNHQINISEKINKGVKKLENEEKNIFKIVSYVSTINKNKNKMNSLSQELMKSIKFSYKEEESNIKYEELYFNGIIYELKKIEKGNCELDYGGKTQGRILFDTNTSQVYYIDGYNSNIINIYENYNNFKSKIINKTITLQSQISGTYSVIHKGFFYFFELKNNNNTNNLIKYDLIQNKILNSKTILPDAILGNSQNCWSGCNDIILITDKYNLYAVYSSKNNNKRISIAKIDENNLNVIKIWNTDSKEKGQCGPIFMINNILYHIKSCSSENDSVIYSYNLENEKSSNINIPFENKGGYDSSLTYYPNFNCLMTVNNYKIYKYNIVLEKSPA